MIIELVAFYSHGTVLSSSEMLLIRYKSHLRILKGPVQAVQLERRAPRWAEGAAEAGRRAAESHLTDSTIL